jgi:hypothetical protein
MEKLENFNKLSKLLIKTYDSFLWKYNESNIESLRATLIDLKRIFGKDQYFNGKIKFLSENENTPECFIKALQEFLILLNKLFDNNITDLELLSLIPSLDLFIEDLTIMIFIVMW